MRITTDRLTAPFSAGKGYYHTCANSYRRWNVKLHVYIEFIFRHRVCPFVFVPTGKLGYTGRFYKNHSVLLLFQLCWLILPSLSINIIIWDYFLNSCIPTCWSTLGVLILLRQTCMVQLQVKPYLRRMVKP